MNASHRAARLNNLRDMLRSGKTYSARELADASGVHVRTVQRDLIVLQTEMGVPLMHHDARYRLPHEQQLAPLSLSLHEARALLIATRLFVRYSDESDPYAASALEKLAGVMPDPVREQVRAAATLIQRRPFDTSLARNLAAVTDAWARRRVLRLSYRSAGKRRPNEVVAEPYFLEPSAAGYATYLIAYSRTHSGMRTFKVERIISAEVLAQTFTLPADLNIDQLLSSAWGIIWGEGVQVRLRFAPGVAWRVKESTWHPSQSIEDVDDGGCVLTLSVASLMELGRWVRGWGDQVEVLSPASLREELRSEAVRLARLYAAPPVPVRRLKGGASTGRRGRPGSVA